MSTEHRERERLHRELKALNDKMAWPAIYSSNELRREMQRERQKVVDKLRDLPLAV
jgi:hypothetical protein